MISNTLIYLTPETFWQPKMPGFTGLHAPVYCFLISHGNHHIVFDLGVRTDWQNYAPKLRSLIEATTKITPGSDVASVLNTDSSTLNIRSSDVQAVIWSHNHFDHIGDITKFPSNTELIVGSGVRAASWPGWPSNADASVLDSDAHERVVREITFHRGDNTALKIGRFDAFDFFGDGSFYLLDAPGHATGHMCAIARTTADPPSFVLMGADACHHMGVLRPSEYSPLPKTLTLAREKSGPMCNEAYQGTERGTSAVDGMMLQTLTIGQAPNAPFFEVAKNSLFADHDAAMDTVRKIQELDASENIFVLLAHDLSLRDQIPLFPKSINTWRADDLRVKTRWLFCRDFDNPLQELDMVGN